MKYSGNSSTGKKKTRNEDRFLIKKFRSGTLLLALADGLGGQPAGHIAAQKAIQVIENFIPGFDNLEKKIVSLILKADNLITKLSKYDPKLEYMGTTLTIVLSYKNRIFWGHVGDARIYHLKGDKLLQITTDQTMAQFLVEEGEITREEALNHSMQNLLDQSLGCGECEPETGSFEVEPGEIVLCCSDGLYSEISADDLKNTLNLKKDIKGKVNLLIKTANDAGGKDNITVMAVEY